MRGNSTDATALHLNCYRAFRYFLTHSDHSADATALQLTLPYSEKHCYRACYIALRLTDFRFQKTMLRRDNCYRALRATATEHGYIG